MGIYATQDDLIIHQKAGNLDFQQNNDLLFEKTKNWLELLHFKNEQIEFYNTMVFNEILGEFWAELLSKNLEISTSKIAFITLLCLHI